MIKALPKMANAASDDNLRNALKSTYDRQKSMPTRLGKILGELDESLKGTKCTGIEGIIEEGSELMEEDFEAEALDAALIGAAQRAEHYEIAGYGCARTYANLLDQPGAASFLERTLEEEKETDQKLTEIAQAINVGPLKRARAHRKRREKPQRLADFGRRALVPNSQDTALRGSQSIRGGRNGEKQSRQAGARWKSKKAPNNRSGYSKPLRAVASIAWVRRAVATSA